MVLIEHFIDLSKVICAPLCSAQTWLRMLFISRDIDKRLPVVILTSFVTEL